MYTYVVYEVCSQSPQKRKPQRDWNIIHKRSKSICQRSEALANLDLAKLAWARLALAKLASANLALV